MWYERDVVKKSDPQNPGSPSESIDARIRELDDWRGATLAGIVEDETVHDPKRGFAGGYHLELAALDLPSLPLAGLPQTMWGRTAATRNSGASAARASNSPSALVRE